MMQDKAENPDDLLGLGVNRTVDPRERDRFAAMADGWRDPGGGPYKMLHLMHFARFAFIRAHAERFLVTPRARTMASEAAKLTGLRALDVGCGGGLAAESLARLGADVCAIDAEARTIKIAAERAVQQNLKIDYRVTETSKLVVERARFDLVLALEIVEHVADSQVFLMDLANLTAPGGLLILSTLNRTVKSYMLAIVGAEYLLRWVPRGTHDWQRFLKPSEVTRPLVRAGLMPVELMGMIYNPLDGQWQLAQDVSVNYLVALLAPHA